MTAAEGRGRLAGIVRHPVKALGREALEAAELRAGETLPGDRLWALAHEAARLDGAGWAPCTNFLRGASSPALMAVEARLHEDGATLTLTHPARPALTLRPDAEGAALVAWARPLVAEGRPLPAALIRAEGQGMTDAGAPWVSVMSLASHRAVEALAGRALSVHRWRGNLWLEGAEPWAERGWIGREIAAGEAVLRVTEPIGRCRATEADPATGARDLDMLRLLRERWGHTEFGVFAEVVRGGRVAVGDAVAA